MHTFALLWLAAAVLFAVVEASTVALVSLWFLGGALAAMVAALLGAKLWLQIVVFVAVTAGLLACLRPFAKKFIQPKITPTNFDRILGRQVPVTEAIDNLRGTGALRIEGKEWSARSTTGESLPEGTLVRIVALEGVKVLVELVSVPAEV